MFIRQFINSFSRRMTFCILATVVQMSCQYQQRIFSTRNTNKNLQHTTLFPVIQIWQSMVMMCSHRKS